MKHNQFFYLLLLLIITMRCSNYNDQNAETDFIVLKGGTLLDGNGGLIENSIIIIRNGKIEAVGGENTPIPSGGDIVDVSGRFITPGFVDAHVHLFQTGFFDARPDALDLRDSLPFSMVHSYQKGHPERYYAAYLGSGVTAIYVVGGMAWSIQLQHLAENNLSAPHIAASGPLITPVPEEYISIFNTPIEKVMVHLESEALGRKSVEHITQLGATGIKIWGMQPESEEFMRKVQAVADEVEKRGNKLIIHATTLAQAKAALRIGAKVLVHSVSDQVLGTEFIELAKSNNAIYTPTLIVSAGYYKSYKAILGDRLIIDDPNGLVDIKTRKLIEEAAKYRDLVDTVQLKIRIENSKENINQSDSIMAINLMRLYEANILIAVGTDAGNPGTLHGISIYDELEAMQKAGIPPEDLIVMATRNGAMAMDRIDDFGTLEKGKMADLIILEKDPYEDISNMRSITHIMRGGLLRSVNEKF